MRFDLSGVPVVYEKVSQRPAFRNRETIHEGDKGRVAGHIAEHLFARLLLARAIPFEAVSQQTYHHDFIVCGQKVDIKAKIRSYSYESRPDRRDLDEGHVTENQEDEDFVCDIYVFASVSWAMERPDAVEFVGWLMKREFWQGCRRVAEGDVDGDHVERKNAGKFKYRDMRPITLLLDLFEAAAVEGLFRKEEYDV